MQAYMLEFSHILGLAGAIVLPVTTTPGGDYPSWALRSEKSAAAVLDYWVDPEGKAYDCKLIGHVGDEKLAGEMCKGIYRSRFEPARDENDQPTTANVVGLMRMIVGDGEQVDKVRAARMRPDAVIEVEGWPVGVRQPYVTTLGLNVDASDAVQFCSAIESTGSSLDQLACERLQDEAFAIGTDREGNPVGYAKSVTVVFDSASNPE